MLIKTFTPKLITPEYLTEYPTLTTRVRGEVRAVMYDLNMRPVLDTGWTPNLITDYGLTSLTIDGIGFYMHIGTSSTAPSFSDVSLGAWVARTQTGNLNVVNPTAPLYEFGMQRRGRFNPGVATGWVREMGLSPTNADNPSTMDVRALLNPAVEKGIDNYLDVYHRMWHYPDLTPHTTQLVLAYDGKTYDCTVGVHDVDNSYYSQSPYSTHYIGSDSFGTYGADGIAEAGAPSLTDNGTGWTNVSGQQNTWPYGLSYSTAGGSPPNPWAESVWYIALDNANFTHGLAGMNTGYGPHTCYTHFKFTDVLDRTKGIPKDETMRFGGTVRMVSTRYTP